MYNLAAEEAIEESNLAAGGLFLEFMERGTLEKWIVKMANERRTFSDRVLWTIFDCLVRGLAGLAYPGKQWRSEESAMNAGDAVNPLVHFDIDQQQFWWEALACLVNVLMPLRLYTR